MLNQKTIVRFLASSALASILACGSSTTTPESPVAEPDPLVVADTKVKAAAPRQAPPKSGASRDIKFPPIARSTVGKGLEVNTVEWHQLPVVYIRLVIRSGGERDPETLPGLADLVASMMKEGTRSRSSAKLAEEVEFLGADFSVGADEESIHVVFRALSEHLDEALALVSDVALNPAFRQGELTKLKKRETDRLALMKKQPNHLAREAFYRILYGDHPYGTIDTNAAALKKLKRTDMIKWHRANFSPSNAFLVVAGDVTPDQVSASAEKAFGSWKNRAVKPIEFAKPPIRSKREVFVVDSPGSVQSVIQIGNLAVPRNANDWVPLMVANQVLGGSAASRLFMDLREKRSLTYGAYSGIGERVQVAPFRASASVRTEVTVEAVEAFLEHLDRIINEPAPADELNNAHRYLSDSFPLKIDTPAKIASLVADLRTFDLPDTYWDSFRTSIRGVDPNAALNAAKRHIRPQEAAIVIVGQASEIAEPLGKFGPVTVLDTDGKVKVSFKEGATEAAAAAKK